MNEFLRQGSVRPGVSPWYLFCLKGFAPGRAAFIQLMLNFNEMLREGSDPHVQNLKEQIFQLFVDLHIGWDIHHVARSYLLFRLEMHKALDLIRQCDEQGAIVFTKDMDFASAKSIEFWSKIEILFDQTEEEIEEDRDDHLRTQIN